MKKLLCHLWLVGRHRRLVFCHALRVGIPYRGLVHDLSKYHPEELFESAKYYQGNRSPIGVCRRETGVSRAWLHHKGRNKHHTEYWVDPDCPRAPEMPYAYLAECICDKLAATKIYKGRSYDTSLPLEHFLKYGMCVPTSEKNNRYIKEVFEDLRDRGEKYILNKKYLKAKYKEIFGREV